MSFNKYNMRLNSYMNTSKWTQMVLLVHILANPISWCKSFIYCSLNSVCQSAETRSHFTTLSKHERLPTLWWTNTTCMIVFMFVRVPCTYSWSYVFVHPCRIIHTWWILVHSACLFTFICKCWLSMVEALTYYITYLWTKA